MDNIILITVLFISLYTDLKSRKILNVVTLPTIILSVIYNGYIGGLDGLLFSGKGFLVGLGLLFIPYIFGGIGAGDVKLMAAIGSLMGTSFVFYSFIYTAIIGGFIALILLIKSKGFMSSTKSLLLNLVYLSSGSLVISLDKSSNISFPYGVAIAFGCLSTLVWGGY